MNYLNHIAYGTGIIRAVTVYDLFAGSHEIAFVKREDIIGDLFISIGDNPVY